MYYTYVLLHVQTLLLQQSDLALESKCVTRFGWLRLCIIVAIGITISSFWKLFGYGVNRDHYEKFIYIREFLELLSLGCFNITFTTDTKTPQKFTSL